MYKTITKEVKLLSLGFMLIFFGFSGTHYYVTTFFAGAGIPSVGFISLILIYGSFAILNPFAYLIISKYGEKKCMLAGAIVYAVYLLFLVARSVVVVYFFSVLLGFAASLLWVGQNTYLIRVSSKKRYGADSGFFSSIYSAGSALGILIIGLLAVRFQLDSLFIIFAAFPLAGFFLFLLLRDLPIRAAPSGLKMIKRPFMSKTLIFIALVSFSLTFIAGLSIGLIPLQITEVLGTPFIGLLSLTHFFPIFFSHSFGSLSDVSGRNRLIIVAYIISVLALVSLYFYEKSMLLVVGVFLVAVQSALAGPILLALSGDASTKNNLGVVSSIQWAGRALAAFFALLVSALAATKTAYVISAGILLFSFVIFLFFINPYFNSLRTKISKEMRQK